LNNEHNGKYSGAEDVYRELVENSDQSWLLGLVAFAVVEEQRIEWMRHYEKGHGALPTPVQVNAWYGQQPPGVLLRAKGTAENALVAYTEEVTAEIDSEHRKEIEGSILVGEIRQLGRFWPQFGVNVAGGFVSALLFAAILAIFAFLVFNDTSPVDMVKRSATPPPGGTNGK
jgi:hypothetical protein